MTDYVEAALSIYYGNELGWNLLAGAAVIAFAVLMSRETHEWWNHLPRRRGKMLRRARRDYVERVFMDDIADKIEERFFNNVYSPEERRELYLKLKKCFPVKDLFPSPELLKEAIKARRAAYIHEPVPLVDRKEKARPKHMFDKPAKA